MLFNSNHKKINDENLKNVKQLFKVCETIEINPKVLFFHIRGEN